MYHDTHGIPPYPLGRKCPRPLTLVVGTTNESDIINVPRISSATTHLHLRDSSRSRWRSSALYQLADERLLQLSWTEPTQTAIKNLYWVAPALRRALLQD